MTARAALAQALLDGHVLTVMNCFKLIGYTNIAREIPRMIETPFGVEVSRTQKTAKSRYGEAVNYVEYRLNKSEYNLSGISEMQKYIASKKHNAEESKPTTEKALPGKSIADYSRDLIQKELF